MPNEQWKERELERFRNGEYKRLPFAGQDWFKCYDFGRYPHLSMVNDRPLIAYTQNETKGIADIQTPMKCGKYLTKYYGPNSENPLFDEKQIASYTEQFMRLFIIPEMLFAKTSSEIKWVYQNGPSSCMSKDLGAYCTGSIHPVEVYGYEGEDSLQVAYIKEDNRVKARAVIFPRTMTHATIYGSASNDDIRLGPALEKAGYTFNRNGFFGAKMKLLYNKHDQIIAPYLDGEGKGVIEGNNCLIISENYDHWCEQIHGLCCEDNRYTCDHCGDHVDEDCIVHIGDTAVCDDCRSEHYFYCEDCNEYHHNNEYREVEGEGICLWCLENGDYFWCEDCEEYFTSNQWNEKPDNCGAVCDSCAKEYKQTYCGTLIKQDEDKMCGCTKCFQSEYNEHYEQKEREKSNV